MENRYKQNTLRHWYIGEYEWNDEKVLLVILILECIQILIS